MNTQCLETDGLCIMFVKTEVGGYLYQLDPRFSALGGKRARFRLPFIISVSLYLMSSQRTSFSSNFLP